MKVYNDLEMMLESELDKIVKKGDLTPNELEAAKKAVCLVKEIQEVKEMKMGSEEGYLERGGNSYYYPMYFNRGNSSGRYGAINLANSRYNRDMRGGRSSYDHNTYDDGRSGHSIQDRMVDRLESMMDEAASDYERQTITEWIEKLNR